MVGIQRLFYLLPALLVANAAVISTSATDGVVYDPKAIGTSATDGVIYDPKATGTLATRNPTLNVTASPGPFNVEDNIGGVLLCHEEQFVNCGYAVQKIGDCINMGTDWAYDISSVGVDHGTIVDLYLVYDCKPDYQHQILSVIWPGLKELNAFDNSVLSLMTRIGGD